MKKIILTLVVFVLLVSMSISARAAVTGWLWGGTEEISDGNPNNGNSGWETGVGWIRMSGDNYGVNIAGAGENLSGQAWSYNIGWIYFDAGFLGGCPSGNCSARRSADGNYLEGWAKIYGISQERAVGNSGGWEGWISLNSSNCATDANGDGISDACGTAIGANYAVNIAGMDGDVNTYNPNSFAWSDELGWIDFGYADITRTLKVCQGSCDSGILPISGTVIEMAQNNSRGLRACYNVSSLCDDATGDVTDPNPALPIPTTWTETSDPNDIVSLNFNSPDQVLSSSSTNRGDGANGANIEVSHDGQTVSFGVEVFELCSYYRCGLASESEDEFSCLYDNSDNRNFNVANSCCSNANPTSPCEFENTSSLGPPDVCTAPEINTPKCGGTGRNPSNWIETSP